VKSRTLVGSAALKATLGRNIRRVRRERGWSQARLATETGLSAGMITKLETGHGNPRVTTLAALARALSVGPTDLLIES
jgi:transcriptional regulator with XRE-family HTH domain